VHAGAERAGLHALDADRRGHGYPAERARALAALAAPRPRRASALRARPPAAAAAGAAAAAAARSPQGLDRLHRLRLALLVLLEQLTKERAVREPLVLLEQLRRQQSEWGTAERVGGAVEKS
jgi:hypothetical protein